MVTTSAIRRPLLSLPSASIASSGPVTNPWVPNVPSFDV
jgi:hypothetical protein